MKKFSWKNVYGVIADMDGVIYRGDKSIKSAIKAIKIWKKKNIKICFLTNNSTKNQIEFKKKLHKMDLNVHKKSIITTSVYVADYLEKKYSNKTKIYIIGSSSLKKTILKKGFVVDKDNASVVISGLDENFTYNKLKTASDLIRKGAKLIGTNSDKIYPIEDGFKPGAGSLVESILASSKLDKCMFIGKPNPIFVSKAVKYLKVKKNNIIFIGDQLETDILAANKSKIYSILVKTGVENTNNKIKPKLIINSLMELPSSK